MSMTLLEGLPEPLVARLKAMRAVVLTMAEPFPDANKRLVRPKVNLSVAFHGPNDAVHVVVTADVVKPEPKQRVVFEVAQAQDADLYDALVAGVNASQLSWEGYLVGVCRG